MRFLVAMTICCLVAGAISTRLRQTADPKNFEEGHNHFLYLNEMRHASEIRSLVALLTANAGPGNGDSDGPFKSILPRLDYQECLKRSICEAHHDRMKYGVIGLAMQLIFPPFDRNIFGSRIRRPFALAAQYGASRRADCNSQYDGCVVSWLRVMQKTVDYIMVKRDNRDSATVHRMIRSADRARTRAQ